MFWDDLTYLNRGSDRQRDAFRIIIELDLFSILAEFDPVLAGTYPLGIETAESDLDILCHAEDLARFTHVVETAYGDEDEFMLRQREKDDLPSVICNFHVGKLPIELFAQPRPTEQQHAYRHMVAEARLLREGGDEALWAIRDLKQDGMKTEPAFGEYFCLDDDPYAALLTLADAPTETLSEVVVKAKFARRDRPVRMRSVMEA